MYDPGYLEQYTLGTPLEVQSFLKGNAKVSLSLLQALDDPKSPLRPAARL